MLLQGTIIKSTGSRYLCRLDDNREVSVVIKGGFRTQNLKTTNPVAVGDRVKISLDSNNENGRIDFIEKRHNHFIRRSRKLSSQYQILAANIDKACVIATIRYPVTSAGFIDRFLVNCAAYEIDPFIIINKTDAYAEEELAKLKQLTDIYQSAGYQILAISAKNGSGLKQLKDKLKDKTTLFTGHSGSGKSTIINKLIPGLNLKTTPLSKSWEKGMHTTTFAEMHSLDNESFIIDTPGIKDIELIEMEISNLAAFMKDFFPFLGSCKFHNCIHLNEPDCAIKEAVKVGKIHASRYKSYLSMIKNEDTFK
jgi:ribosome biogenesis GTPase / thiamine phosphate phosphatase